MMTLSVLLLLVAPQDPPAAPQDRAAILKQDIEDAIKRLGSDRYTDSYVARVELAEIGRPAVPAVLAELGKDNAKPAVKRALCEILGDVRDSRKEVVDLLSEKLKDYDEYGTSIAAAAARSLAAVGDESCVPALLATLTSSRIDLDKVLKYECIRALGLFRARRAEDALRKALEDKKGATVITGDQDAPLIAAAAADALGRIRSRAAVEDLAKLLGDQTKNPPSGQTLNVHAARALRRIHESELRGKTEKDDARAGVLSGSSEDVQKTVTAWKDWWAEIRGERKIADTRKKIGEIAAAVEAFKKAQGKYPEILAYIKTYPDAKDFPEGGYYKGDLLDAWKREIRYRHEGTGAPYDVFSYGNDDRLWGTGINADIYNHDKWKEVKTAASKKAIEDTVKVLEKFKKEQGRYPDQIVDLVTRPKFAVKNWPEKGYLQKVPKDGWDNYLRFRIPGTGGEAFDLISIGADLKEGGEGVDEDLWNHDKRPEKKKDETKKEDGKDGK